MTTPRIVSEYDLNDLVRFTVDFVSTDNVTLADASTVNFLLLNPSGVVASFTNVAGAGGSITRLGVGLFAKDVTLNAVGSWFYRWEGTGGVQANDEWSCLVKRSFIL